MKIRPVGAELCHADRRRDGQTDKQTNRHDGANSRFLQFCERAWKHIFNATPGVNDCQIIFWLKIPEREKIFHFHPIIDINSKFIKKEATVCFKLSIVEKKMKFYWYKL
jgi:hypothetical protein